MKRPRSPGSRARPFWPLSPGREHYVPDEGYFSPSVAHPVEPAEHPSSWANFRLESARITTRTMALWASRYAMHLYARKLTIPPEEWQTWVRRGRQGAIPPHEQIRRAQEGNLPTGREEREALIDAFFREFQEIKRLGIQVSPSGMGISLFLDEAILLEQDDGMPGPLAASPEEFALLQASWEQAGLPRNLYYAARDERLVMDGEERYGGVVRRWYIYSPRQWEERLQARIKPLPIPSEEKRLETFIAACDRFAQAVALRIAELSEPGQQINPTRLQHLKTVYHEVSLAALRAREALLPSPEPPIPDLESM
jgi:hypothetical protein